MYQSLPSPSSLFFFFFEVTRHNHLTGSLLHYTVNTFPYFQKYFNTFVMSALEAYKVLHNIPLVTLWKRFQSSSLSLSFLSCVFVKCQITHFCSIAQHLWVNSEVGKKVNLLSILGDLIFWSFCVMTVREADITSTKSTDNSDFLYK